MQQAVLEEKLLMVIAEFEGLMGEIDDSQEGSFAGHLEHLRELVSSAGEYGMAYRSILDSLKKHRIRLSSEVAVALLEVAPWCVSRNKNATSSLAKNLCSKGVLSILPSAYL